jgi:lactoylglutathione lyase
MTSDTGAAEMDLWCWGADATKPRFLHTMIRVKEFDASLRFYLDGLGMKVLDRFDVKVNRVTAMFIGFDGYAAGGCIELVHPWDDEGPYTHAKGHTHISIGVPSLSAMLAKLEPMGVEVIRPPKVLIPGGPAVAFVKDPNGYQVELIQTNRN